MASSQGMGHGVRPPVSEFRLAVLCAPWLVTDCAIFAVDGGRSYH